VGPETFRNKKKEHKLLNLLRAKLYRRLQSKNHCVCKLRIIRVGRLITAFLCASLHSLSKNIHILGRTVNCIYRKVKRLVGGTIYGFLTCLLKTIVNKRLLYNDK
jgi:hypothetical protein